MFIYISLNFIDEKNKNSYAWHICLYMYKNGVSSLWGIKIFKDINIVLFEFKEFSHIHCRWYLSWPYQSPLKTRTLKWTIYVSEWRIELFFFCWGSGGFLLFWTSGTKQEIFYLRILLSFEDLIYYVVIVRKMCFTFFVRKLQRQTLRYKFHFNPPSYTVF